MKSFIKRLNERTVLVEDLVTLRKISQNEKQNERNKDQMMDVLNYFIYIYIYIIALVMDSGMQYTMEEF